MCSIEPNTPTDAHSTPNLHFVAPLDIERLAAGSRGHWGVESMHWVLNVEFKDDLSRYRAGHGANMAVVRRFALGLLRANKSKGSIKTRLEISELEYPVPPRNPADEMIVDLEFRAVPAETSVDCSSVHAGACAMINLADSDA